jgi:hypothetical protein
VHPLSLHKKYAEAKPCKPPPRITIFLSFVWSSDDDEDDFVAPQRTPALARIFFCCFFRARVSVIELADVVAKLLVVALIVSCAYVVDVRFYFSFLSFWCETESNRSRPRLARQKQRR